MNISWSCDSAAKAAEMVAKAPAGIAKGAEIVRDAAKGYAPFDTGRLRGSIESRAAGMSATVGTNVEYGIYQEFGTYKMAVHPYLRPALTSSKDAVLAAVKAAIS